MEKKDENRERQKLFLIISVVVIGVIAAIYSGVRALSPPAINIVGTIPAPPGGLRDAERTGGETPQTDARDNSGKEEFKGPAKPIGQ